MPVWRHDPIRTIRGTGVQKKTRDKFFLSDRFFLILGLCCFGLFLLYIILSTKGGMYFYRLGIKTKNLNNMNQQLSDKNAALRKKIERIKTDASYQEEISRKELGLVRENEIIYSFEQNSGSKKGHH